jgi:N utilization substance protein B
MTASPNPSRGLTRSAARLAAVQALYQHDMEATPVAQLLHEFHQHRLGSTIDEEEFDAAEYADAEVDFFDDLVRGTLARLDEIDAALGAKLSAGWTLARLDRSMKAVLRVGTYELIARPDVPAAAAISEYVDVAKAFHDAREAGFVNGVLDAVAKANGR